MSIPKIIHYCWFGRNAKPELALKCIKSWQKYCPDYEIIEWNEDNFDINACPLYVQDAYTAGLYAFVSDYARIKIVYDNGGIYLDTDVELIKSLDCLLQNQAFFGFEDKKRVATGLGFGAEKEFHFLLEIMGDYNKVSFINDDGSINYTTCPDINTPVFLRHGLVQNNKKQLLDGGILILPTEYLCPINYHTDRLRKTHRTISIHWFAKSWMTEASRLEHEERRQEVIKDFWIHLPNRALLRLLGTERYNKIKQIIKTKKNM